MSDKDQDNIFSISKRRRLNFLNSEEGQEVLGNAFVNAQLERNKQPLTLSETENQRQYCQWQIRLLDERVDRGYISQPAEIEHARDQLAVEIREIRNDWPNAQWRFFVEQGGDVPVTLYASSRKELKAHVGGMRSDWKDQISERQAEGEDFDVMQSKHSLESDIFDVENTSFKIWNEREQIQNIVDEFLKSSVEDGLLSSSIVTRIKKFFDTGIEGMRAVAMEHIKNLHNNDRLDECHEAIDWGVENNHLTEFEAASLREGKIPSSEHVQGVPDLDPDEPSV